MCSNETLFAKSGSGLDLAPGSGLDQEIQRSQFWNLHFKPPLIQNGEI